jgi:hypothetical protein
MPVRLDSKLYLRWLQSQGKLKTISLVLLVSFLLGSSAIESVLGASARFPA